MTDPAVRVVYYDDMFFMPPGIDPPPERFASTPGDNLCELACRVCYRSADRSAPGRSSRELFENVLAKRHHSVIAHVVETYEVRFPDPDQNLTPELMAGLHCRPGVWVTRVFRDGFRFCVNLRALTEWAEHGPEIDDYWLSFIRGSADVLRDVVAGPVRDRYPLAASRVAPPKNPEPPVPFGSVTRVAPALPKEKWCSLHVSGVSRDLLQELVRHHWQANPSVESTRYVDKSADEMTLHPALRTDGAAALAVKVRAQQDDARALYAEVFRGLREQGVDKKTAAGAARSCLPGAATTELVFSLSQFQARHLIALRISGSADPEIRILARKTRDELLKVWPDL